MEKGWVEGVTVEEQKHVASNREKGNGFCIWGRHRRRIDGWIDGLMDEAKWENDGRNGKGREGGRH